MENPYRAPSSRIEDLGSAANTAELAGRWVRLGAVIIDAIIQGVPSLAIVFATGYLQWATQALRTGELSMLNYLLMSTAMGLVAFVLIQGYPLVTSGQTWGKKACSIKIVDLDGRLPSVGRLAARYGVSMLPGVVPFVGGLVSLIDICFIFRGDRRCIHDLVAGTRVVGA